MIDKKKKKIGRRETGNDGRPQSLLDISHYCFLDYNKRSGFGTHVFRPTNLFKSPSSARVVLSTKV